MIGLDTKVIVRYIMQDDPTQSPKTTRLVERLTRDQPGFVSRVTVVEAVLVLSAGYRLRSQCGHRSDLRVDVIRAVKRDVAIALNQYLSTGRNHAVRVETLPGELKSCCGVNPHGVEGLIFASSSTRVGINLAGDQFLNGLLAITNDTGGLAFGCGEGDDVVGAAECGDDGTGQSRIVF